MAETKTTAGVQSVERAFELLELIARAGGEAALSEIAAETSLPLPTIHRLLRTLVGIGYVRQLANRRYSLGPRLIRLGEVANRQLGALSTPILKSLVTELGESANIAVLDGDMVTYISQAQSPHSMRMITEVGRRSSLHGTGVGKAILAELDDDRVQRLVNQAGMAQQTPRPLPPWTSSLPNSAPFVRAATPLTKKNRNSVCAAWPWRYRVHPRRWPSPSPAPSRASPRSSRPARFRTCSTQHHSFPRHWQ